jgi:hypothetical protein
MKWSTRVLLVTALGSISGFVAGEECVPPAAAFELAKEGGVFTIRVAPAFRAKWAPDVSAGPYATVPLDLSVSRLVGAAAAESGAMPILLGAVTKRAVPFGSQWQAGSAREAVAAFAAAIGLEFQERTGDVWLLSEKSTSVQQRQARVLVYSLGAPADMPVLQSVGRSLVGSMGLASFSGTADRNWIAVGLRKMPDGRRWLALITRSDKPGATAIMLQARSSSGLTRVDCTWSEHVGGAALDGFEEDVDSDGVADLFFKSEVEGEPDVLLSGSDGRVLAAVNTRELVTTSVPGGGTIITVEHVWSDEGATPTMLLCAKGALACVKRQQSNDAERAAQAAPAGVPAVFVASSALSGVSRRFLLPGSRYQNAASRRDALSLRADRLLWKDGASVATRSVLADVAEQQR